MYVCLSRHNEAVIEVILTVYDGIVKLRRILHTTQTPSSDSYISPVQAARPLRTSPIVVVMFVPDRDETYTKNK